MRGLNASRIFRDMVVNPSGCTSAWDLLTCLAAVNAGTHNDSACLSCLTVYSVLSVKAHTGYLHDWKWMSPFMADINKITTMVSQKGHVNKVKWTHVMLL